MFLLCLLLILVDVQPCDLERFPTCEDCREALAFNRAYRDCLLTRLRCEWHHEAEITEALGEAERLYDTWACLWRAQFYRGCEYGADNLRDLRQRLGETAYLAGSMPPCVPLARFREIDLPTTYPARFQ